MPITKQALDRLADLKLRPSRFEVLNRLIQGYIEQDKMQAIVIKALRYGVPIYEIAAGTNTREGGVRMDTIFLQPPTQNPLFPRCCSFYRRMAFWI